MLLQFLPGQRPAAVIPPEAVPLVVDAVHRQPADDLAVLHELVDVARRPPVDFVADEA